MRHITANHLQVQPRPQLAAPGMLHGATFAGSSLQHQLTDLVLMLTTLREYHHPPPIG